MKNKIISWLLLASMFLTLFLTSCSDVDTGYEEETTTIPSITLTLYGIMEEGTTDEAIKLVEERINRYTKDAYKTTVELHLFTEEEYDQVIDDAFVKIAEQQERNENSEKAATAAAKAAREAAKKLSEDEQKEKRRAQREYTKWAEKREQESENEGLDELNIEMSDDVQLDIFLVNDYDRFSTLVEEERITDLSSAITGTHALITKFVNPAFLGAGKLNGMYYGVPANRLMGSGKVGYYYAFRTDLVEKYNYTLTEVPALATQGAIDTWLEAIIAGGEEVVPFFAPPATIQGFDFYMDNMLEYPAYGTKNNEGGAIGTGVQPVLYGNNPLNEMDQTVAFYHLRKMYKFRTAGYFAPEGSDPATTDFAVGVFYGTLDEVKAQLGDRADLYTYATYSYPRVVTEDVFGSTFVVSSSCKYSTRAVELIRGFCTVEELRNLITFGVQDVHYTLNEDGETVKKISNDYNIGFERFGNSLIGYVPEELGATYQADAIIKNQNVKTSAYVGYSHMLEEEGDIKAFEEINKIVGEYIVGLMNGYDVSTMTDVDGNGTVDINDVFEELLTRIGKYEDVLKLYPDSKEGEDYEAPYDRLLASLDGNFSSFASSRPGGGVAVIDNSIITKEEKERRKELEAAENPEAEEVVDPSVEGELPAEGEVLPEGETPVEGEILPEVETPAEGDAVVETEPVEETTETAPVEE